MAKYREQGLSCQGPWRPVRELVFILGNQKPLESFKPCYGEQIRIKNDYHREYVRTRLEENPTQSGRWSL